MWLHVIHVGQKVYGNRKSDVCVRRLERGFKSAVVQTEASSLCEPSATSSTIEQDTAGRQSAPVISASLMLLLLPEAFSRRHAMQWMFVIAG